MTLYIFLVLKKRRMLWVRGRWGGRGATTRNHVELLLRRIFFQQYTSAVVLLFFESFMLFVATVIGELKCRWDGNAHIAKSRDSLLPIVRKYLDTKATHLMHRSNTVFLAQTTTSLSLAQAPLRNEAKHWSGWLVNGRGRFCACLKCHFSPKASPDSLMSNPHMCLYIYTHTYLLSAYIIYMHTHTYVCMDVHIKPISY